MHSRRILLVEDERIVALDVANRLRGMGFEVVGHAADSDAALRLAEEKQPELILMDVKIAGERDGIDTAKLIHERESIPVVFLTAFDDQALLDRAKEVGTFGYVLKPFQERELSIAIDLALYKSDVARELTRAKEEAERAADAKAKFLAAMSHELRTPLNSIIGMADLAAEHSYDQTQAEYLGILKDSAETLLLLINNILDFSKLDAGKLALSSEPFNLRKTAERAVSNVLGQAIEAGLTLDLWVDPQLPQMVVGDHYRLLQVLINLLGNAVKFTTSGGCELEIARDGRSVRFVVSDTGCGIPEDERDRVFDPFSQVYGAERAHAPGTGIGLSLCKRVVELMGGTLEMESTVGAGSTFRFSLSLPAHVLSEEWRPSLPKHVYLWETDERTRGYLCSWVERVAPETLLEPFPEQPDGSGRSVWPDAPVLVIAGTGDQRGVPPPGAPKTARVVHRPLRMEEVFDALRAPASDDEAAGGRSVDEAGESPFEVLFGTCRTLIDAGELDELSAWLSGFRRQVDDDEELSGTALRLLLAARKGDPEKVTDLLESVAREAEPRIRASHFR